MKKAIGLLLFAMTSVLTGCSALQDCVIETEMDTRNSILTQKAWLEWSWVYDDLEFPYHFAKGFKAGYRDVLEGGSGCQPTLPPRCYWKPCFQTPVGRCQVHAWFDGFSHGALGAKQDGFDGLSEIPISPRVKTNIEVARRRPVETQQAGAGVGHAEPTPLTGTNNPLLSPPDPDGNVANPVLLLPNTKRPYEE